MLATSDFNGGLFAVLVLLTFAMYLWFAVPWYPVFRKVGIPGHYAFVPFAHTYFVGRLTGRTTPRMYLFGAFAWIAAMHDLAACFGKKDRFGFGLIMLPPVFLLILGFGKAEYHGPLTGEAVPVGA